MLRRTFNKLLAAVPFFPAAVLSRPAVSTTAGPAGINTETLMLKMPLGYQISYVVVFQTLPLEPAVFRFLIGHDSQYGRLLFAKRDYNTQYTASVLIDNINYMAFTQTNGKMIVVERQADGSWLIEVPYDPERRN
jgi:hypothetical protein